MDITAELNGLFQGYQGAYTRSVPLGDSVEAGQKAEVKYDMVWGTPGIPQWVDHLDGKAALSLGTINESNQCNFAVIDIDRYDLDLPSLKHRLIQAGLPCVLCRSKSGGPHIFFFFSKPTPAKLVRTRLLEIAAFLGHSDKAEVFPLTAELKNGDGVKDTSRMSAMPYFGGEVTTRYALLGDGTSATVEEFIEMAKAVRIPFEELNKVALPESDWFKDGPPCLQHISRVGIGEGMRNDTLFAIGVYCKKKYEKDGWEDKLEEHNRALCVPPLTAIEMQNLIKSLRGKAYDYTCKRAPLKPHCNSGVCRQREYGVGDNNAMSLGIIGLTKIDTDPPIWLVDFSDGMKMPCSTNDLTDQTRFQLRCMDAMNIMPHIIKREDWTEHMRELLLKVVIVPVPKDETNANILKGFIYDYCEKGAQAHKKSDIFISRPWYEDGKHWIRLVDLIQHLKKKKDVISIEKNQVIKCLKDMDAEHGDLKIGSKYCNVWMIPSRDTDAAEERKRDLADAHSSLSKNHVDAY